MNLQEMDDTALLSCTNLNETINNINNELSQIHEWLMIYE